MSNNQKKNKAISFKKNRMIDNINEKNISVTTYKINTSNILTILDKFIEIMLPQSPALDGWLR